LKWSLFTSAPPASRVHSVACPAAPPPADIPLPREPESSALTERLHEVVDGQWDLSAEFPTEAPGQNGVMGRLLNRLFEKLSGALTHCASNTISLSKISPQLAAVSTELAANAQVQSARAQEIASSVGILESASSDLKAIAEIIERTAFQSKLLAVNASIEATRAGEHGRAFGAVAEEIQRLSRETSEASGKVSAIIGAIQEQIKRTARAVGVESGNSSHRVGAPRDSLSTIAATQAEQAMMLNSLAHKSHSACDELVLAMGVFRIAAHSRARRLIEELVANPDMKGFEPGSQERVMREFVAQHNAFELLYVTDGDGRQVTRNISPGDFQAAYKTDGRGSDWSARPWFQGARESRGSFVSDVYKSAASKAFCFTVSTTIFDLNGRPRGVIGADVRLENLLAASL
jgi:methyl-accepting chemotaxis protein